MKPRSVEFLLGSRYTLPLWLLAGLWLYLKITPGVGEIRPGGAGSTGLCQLHVWSHGTHIIHQGLSL